MLSLPTPPQNKKQNKKYEFQRKREYVIMKKQMVYNLLFDACGFSDEIKKVENEQKDKMAVYDLIFRS